jgi:hypothetical protein
MKKDKSLKNMLDSEFFTNAVYNKTKYNLVKTIVDKYAHEKLDSLKKCEDLADDVINILYVVGADMYGRYGQDLDKGDKHDGKI